MHADLEKALMMAEKAWGAPLFIVDDVEITYADIDGARWIAFNATNSTADLLANLRAWPTKRPYGWVHSGIFKKLMRVLPILTGIMQEKTVFTGHSYGGQLAQIAAVETGNRAVVTGSPKVFLTKPKRTVDIIRFETENDPAPFWPPFYRHVGIREIVGSEAWIFKAHFLEEYDDDSTD